MTKYLEYDDTYWVIDIETEEAKDFRPNIIWCMCYENVKTGEKGDCIGHEAVASFFSERSSDVFIGHNGLAFDFEVLRRVIGASIPINRCIDTLVLSMLYSPNILGGHSLGEWALRLGREKGDFHDFSKFSQEMLEYCRLDVSLTVELYRRLVRTMGRIGFSERSVWIQHRFWAILDTQRRNGFCFDGPRAISLLADLRAKEGELKDDIQRVFLPKRHLVATRQMHTKAGRDTAIYEADRGRYECCPTDGGRYEAYEHVAFNVGSPKQRVDRLLELGWEPEEFTDAGQPKPFEKGKVSPSLERFLEHNDVPEARLMAKYMTINGRANMIQTWLNEWNQDDGCIHGKLFVADTLRLRHQAPNTANIPGVRTTKDGDVLRGDAGEWTYEARDTWIARPGRVLVGTDAAGLELRMLAHYINRPDFTETVLTGDPHQYNADAVGITRSLAKTLLYAIQYGAQDKKVAKIIGCSLEYGSKTRLEFLERLGLKEVMDDAIAEQKSGRIRLVDGSLVVCPSPHAALNYRLQGGGARVMALANVLLDRETKKRGLDSLKVGDVHDEYLFDVYPDDAEEHAEISVWAIRHAGELLELNIPLDGKALIGHSWAVVH